MRPAQWLGLVKIMAVWGAEWFYAGFFNVKFDSHGAVHPPFVLDLVFLFGSCHSSRSTLMILLRCKVWRFMVLHEHKHVS